VQDFVGNDGLPASGNMQVRTQEIERTRGGIEQAGNCAIVIGYPNRALRSLAEIAARSINNFLNVAERSASPISASYPRRISSGL